MKKLLISFTMILMSTGLWAQPAEGKPGDSPTPIDGGISLLLAAGAAFGGKKAYDAYRKKDA